MRHDQRQPDQLRPIRVTRHFTSTTPGSVLIEAGKTMILVTASIAPEVPPWLEGKGQGWVTAEYNMLPGSTSPRKRRDRDGRPDSRSIEIQRLIGRSLRAVIDLEILGERTVTIDCDVLQADGGTRTLSVTGGLIALVDAVHAIRGQLPGYPLRDSVAAVSVGLVDGQPLLDLNHVEDSAASVDMNIVLSGSGRLVEIQGTGEEATFSEDELAQLLRLARGGIARLREIQREALGAVWAW